MAETLCTACARFIRELGQVEQGNWKSTRTLAPNIHSLRKLAQNGCALCQIVYQSCFYYNSVSWDKYTYPIQIEAFARMARPKGSAYNIDDKQQHKEENKTPFGYQYAIQLNLSVCVGEGGKGMHHDLPMVSSERLWTPANAPGSHMAKSIMDLSLNDSLEHAVALAKEWMLKCSVSHTRCNKDLHTEPQAKIVPTRLIDVGSKDGEARIYIPDQRAQDVQYAALSYAWGSGHDFAKTTASNINEMTKCLPWNDLAKTIQDAIIFTRKLGIRYLWVDALCIFQSEGPKDAIHKADWSYEAGRFGHYYQNAILTIAATGADSSDKGLFLARPALEFDPRPVTFQQSTSSGGSREYTIQPISPSWSDELVNSPLLSRGWAIQERALSKRILHFGMNCILWECHECRAIETDPGCLDPIVSDDSNDDFILAFRDLQTHQQETVIRSWYDFATEYSMTKFSFESDRLPALSGIAARVQDRFPQKYIAGIWEFDIPKGLAWNVPGVPGVDSPSFMDLSMGVEGDPTHSELTLPSWSWASSNRLIHFSSPRSQWNPLVQVLDWTVKTKGADTSGQILQARLRLQGLFKMMNLADLNSSLHYVFFDRAGLIHDAELAEYFGGHLYPCILIGTENKIWRNFGGHIVMGVALILKRTGQSTDSVEEYKRLGILRVSYKEYWLNVQDTKIIELI